MSNNGSRRTTQLELEIDGGPETRQTVKLGANRIVRVGRNNDTDLPLPNDPMISGRHFEVSCGEEGSCRIRDLESTNGTFLNGEQVTEAEVREGDEVTAGETVFRVRMQREEAEEEKAETQRLDGRTEAAAAKEGGQEEAGSPFEELNVETDADGYVALSAAEIARNVEFEEDRPPDLLQDGQSPREFLETLRGGGYLSDATRFLAHALPKREAVWWACQCVRAVCESRLSEGEQTALVAAEAWAADPIDENRRAAHTAAEDLDFEAPSAWSAVGAFWSSGSLGAPDAPTVKPQEDLTGRAVSTAIKLAAVEREPDKAQEKQQQFLDLAIAVAQGENRWPQGQD